MELHILDEARCEQGHEFDALHLASCRAEGQSELVATDKRMRDAAKLLGLSLFPA